MNDSTAMAAYQPQTAALMQQQGGPQGISPTVVPLDRDSLLFYANMITMANLVPVENNVPAEVSKSRVMAKIVSGASYGFDPILAQGCYDVLFNRLTLNANAMEILFRDSGEYDSRVTYLKDDACRVDVLQLKGGTWSAERNQFTGGTWHKIGEVEFTFAMAEMAGLPKTNPNWNKYRQDMLYSKVMKRIVKRYNPGCLRPRTLLGNYFAKSHQLAAPEPPPVSAQITGSTPEPAAPETTGADISNNDQPYREPVYTGGTADIDDDGTEAVIHEYTGTAADTPTTIEGIVEPELNNDTENLRDQVKELMSALPANRQRDILAGKNTISKSDHAELLALKEILDKEQ